MTYTLQDVLAYVFVGVLFTFAFMLIFYEDHIDTIKRDWWAKGAEYERMRHIKGDTDAAI